MTFKIYRILLLLPASEYHSKFNLKDLKRISWELLEEIILTAYKKAAMRSAHYELLDSGEGYIGKIPGLQGVWANADTLQACRDELREVLEEWIIFGLKMNHTPSSIPMT